jgi:hypothetical protein
MSPGRAQLLTFHGGGRLGTKRRAKGIRREVRVAKDMGAARDGALERIEVCCCGGVGVGG